MKDYLQEQKKKFYLDLIQQIQNRTLKMSFELFQHLPCG